jgi:hypothetical protein
MDLNLPIASQVAGCKNLLIAGMGGGFDIFCGLPIYLELQRQGQKAHLANFSFTPIADLKSGERLTSTLVGVQAHVDDFLIYFPELYLAQWFAERRGEHVSIWCFEKTGAGPLLDNYRVLVDRLGIDGILLIDGGVDSLMRGNEAETGTMIEDAISLFAVNELTQIPTRIIACLGFGAEQDVSYTHVLENIAALTQAGGFLGACSLTPKMPVYQAYEEAVCYAQAKPYQDASVINSCIVSAGQGRFGDHHLTEKTRGSRMWISPLMLLYWFFDLKVVAQHSLFLYTLRDTPTFMTAVAAAHSVLASLPRRSTPSLPL